MTFVHETIGDDYLRRWGVKFKSGRAIYLHHFTSGDPCLNPHDHPKDFTSLGLWGTYVEWAFADGTGELFRGCGMTRPKFKKSVRWTAPWFRRFRAEHTHVIARATNCWTLVWTGPTVKNWGFYGGQR